ncbi:hypothetical protein B0H16DRAFT_1700768 [Mycena metata]|uniref:Uncharacterized protein n=1 Tax=Mycena metata TaxID=1033252 RepID=A0AAD7MHQ5_9AGAR|nr:hypothetical protein B0H16DRAFT_1700768 [Mycena metata]
MLSAVKQESDVSADGPASLYCIDFNDLVVLVALDVSNTEIVPGGALCSRSLPSVADEESGRRGRRDSCWYGRKRRSRYAGAAAKDCVPVGGSKCGLCRAVCLTTASRLLSFVEPTVEVAGLLVKDRGTIDPSFLPNRTEFCGQLQEHSRYSDNAKSAKPASHRSSGKAAQEFVPRTMFGNETTTDYNSYRERLGIEHSRESSPAYLHRAPLEDSVIDGNISLVVLNVHVHPLSSPTLAPPHPSRRSTLVTVVVRPGVALVFHNLFFTHSVLEHRLSSPPIFAPVSRASQEREAPYALPKCHRNPFSNVHIPQLTICVPPRNREERPLAKV